MTSAPSSIPVTPPPPARDTPAASAMPRSRPRTCPVSMPVAQDLRDADLSVADLHGSSLMGARLQNASLTSANIAGADCAAVDATGAQLVDADLSGVKCRAGALRGRIAAGEQRCRGQLLSV